MICQETIKIVKATAPVLVKRGEEITRFFYRRMFADNPEVRPLFNPAHQHQGTQQQALAGSICAFAENIDNLDALGPAVELIAQKHASLGVKPEHYPIVGKHLLASIGDVLGEAATEPILEAWAEAYGYLSDLLISREGKLYSVHRGKHGWEGFRRFEVQNKVDESDTIVSFYLTPLSKEPLAEFLPGQYVTVRLPDTEGVETTMRNYSLSDRPRSGHYRISVKRESSISGEPAGHVSNYLHSQIAKGDILEVGPPCGEFTYSLNCECGDRRPLVLLSGGIGITPVLSMLNAIVHAKIDREIYFIHGAINGLTHAFFDEVHQLVAQHPRTTVHIRYSDPMGSDLRTSRCDSEGFVDMSLIQQLLPSNHCEYYFCGPKPFMTGLYQGLLDWGVDASQLNFEFFGPMQELARKPEGVSH